jgi:hypothetical protein
MGRPRAKRSAITAERCSPGVLSGARPSGNSGNSGNSNNNDNHNTNNTNNDKNNNNGNNMNSHIGVSRPSTPAAPRQYAGHGISETVVVAAPGGPGRLTSPILEAWNSEESTALPDEQSQRLISWSPLSGGDFALVGGGSGCSSAAEPMASFLSTDSPMDLDCVSRCLEMEMPSFLQDLPNSPASSHPPLAMPLAIPAGTPKNANANAFASPPLDLLLQIPPPARGNNGKDPPSFASAEPHSLLQQGTRQEQHFGADSDLFSRMAAESPRQSMTQTYAMDHMLDDPGFGLASRRADGGRDKRLSQGSTCFSQSPLLGCTNPGFGRHGGAARRLSPPSTADAKLRTLSGFHGFGGFLDGRADAPAEENEDNDVDGEGEEEEDDEEASIPSSYSSSSRSDPETSLDEQCARMYGAGAGTGGHCGCVSAMSRCIVSLRSAEQQQRMGIPLPLDAALLLEGEVTTSLSRIDRCRTCRRESGAVHLLALVGVRMMVQLLQKTVRDEFASRRRQSEFVPDVGAATGGGSEGGGGGMLWIGKFKVMPRARLRFLRRLLQARFYRLAVLVGEREQLDHDLSSGDCFAGASSLLLADISQGLRTVMGWLELWNSKPR